VRGFSLTAPGFTAETDWLLEEGGFEPSVPAGDQRGLLGSRLETEELRNYQEYFSRGQDKINKTIPGVGISGEGIVSEKIER
jgi:hypothetical protein